MRSGRGLDVAQEWMADPRNTCTVLYLQFQRRPTFIPIPMKKTILLSILIAMPANLFADWKSDADARIEKLRKGDFSVVVTGVEGARLKGATVDYRLKRHDFLFGTAIAHRPFSNEGEYGKAYRQFILGNFSGLVCENEMKWYDIEEFRDKLNYEPADAMLAFAEDNGLKMRGHCIFWAKPARNEDWVVELDGDELRAEMVDHIESIVPRYAGRLVAWDVNNEMLDGRMFRDKLGDDIAVWMHKEAARLDPDAELFVNEYGILGVPEKTERYIELIKWLQSEGAPVHGIGIQSHDSDRLTADPNAKAIDDGRSEGFLKEPLTPEAFLGTLDRFWSETRLPVHLTEISSRTPDANHRAETLDMLFRLGFSHESVEAILLWGFAEGAHWMGPDATLMDAEGNVNVAGRRISDLMQKEWTTAGRSKSAGNVSFRGFYGTYEVTVTLADGSVKKREVSLTKDAPGATVDLGG